MTSHPEKLARAEAMLGELAELSLMVARELAVRVRESEDADETVALAGAFDKTTRVVRLTLALDAKLTRDAARDATDEAREARELAAGADAEAARAAERRRAEEAAAARAARPADPVEARKRRVRGLMDRHRDEWKAAKLQVADARAALRAVVQTQPLNEGAVRSAADGLGRAIGDRAVLRGRVGSEVRQFLTGDQAARLDALRAEREARRTGTREKAAER